MSTYFGLHFILFPYDIDEEHEDIKTKRSIFKSILRQRCIYKMGLHEIHILVLTLSQYMSNVLQYFLIAMYI